MKLTPCCVLLRGMKLLVINLLISNSLISQNTSVCPIGVGMEPASKSDIKSASLVNEIYSPYFVKWSDLGYLKLADDKKAGIVLSEIMRSRQIMGNNLKFQIPVGAEIQGITLMIEGQSDHYQNIDEVEVVLLNKDGEPKGLNKKNTAKLQKAWNKGVNGNDHQWMYGSSTDTWGAAWTAEELNNPNFGYQIQIRNIEQNPINISIDQISVIVHYTPAYSFCDDKCLTFYIDKYEQYGSYLWHYPEAFQMVSASVKQQTIDLKTGTAPFGLYQICADVFDYNDEYVETCCRNFVYQNCNSSEIKGIAWIDLNDNKLRENNEGILSNVSLILYTDANQPVDTLLTDNFGKYHFKNLPTGKYYIKTQEFTDKKTILFNSADPDRNSDITNANGPATTDIITTETGQCVENIDFGYTPLVSLGDFVWLDKNFNGLQDSGEPGIKNVKVKLCTQSGFTVDSVITDNLGHYKFENFPANKYFLKFDIPQDYKPTTANGSNQNLNSKIDNLGKTPVYTLITSGYKDNVDAGFYQTSVIGDLVWEDKNGNGIYNAGELPLSGIMVTCTGIAGNGQNIQLTTTTDAGGNYRFVDVPPGLYDIQIVAPAEYVFTLSNEGDDTTDSDFIDGQLTQVEVQSGSVNLNIDAGLYRLGSISDFVWSDENGNGIQDPGEKGISGVKITLVEQRRDENITVATTFTDVNGYYIFDDLKPGMYQLFFEISDGYYFTTSNAGADDTKDSDVINGLIDQIMLMSGERNDTYDAGLYKFAVLGDYVWEDANGNGLQDAGEHGLSDVPIELTGITGSGVAITANTVTDSDGEYSFSNLSPGVYTITVQSPFPFKFTASNMGSDEANDSDGMNGQVVNILLTSGAEQTNIDFGLYKYAAIGDFVWEDVNGNGQQDAGENGIGNVSLHLSGTTGAGMAVNLTSTTDNSGNYIFESLIPGSYTISLDLPAGYTFSAGGQGTDTLLDSDFYVSSSNQINMASGQNRLDIDAGLFRSGLLGDFVWHDINGNGIQDNTEPGIAGVQITLSGVTGVGNNVLKSYTTTEDGRYLFDQLEPGIYFLDFTPAPGFEFTTSDLGNNDLTDSDVINNAIAGILVTSGQIIDHLDAGLLSRSSIGDFIWVDMNGNGKQDVGEKGMSNVEIRLQGTTGNAGLVDENTVTDANGYYSFGNLLPGIYTLTVTIPSGYSISSSDQGTDDDLDSDGTDGVITGLVLVSGEHIDHIDFGLLKGINLGDFVWEDLNSNGIQDEGEPGISGIDLTLSGTTFGGLSITQQTTSDDNGGYLFTGITPGVYTISILIPSEYTPTKVFAGNDPEKDSDLSENLNLIDINVVTSVSDLSIDIGLVRLGSIGDLVWEDLNCNGVREAGEPGVPGVKVVLDGIDLFNAIIQKEMVTDQNGAYLFDKLKPGAYTISFEVPAGYEFSAAMINVVNLSSGQSALNIDAPLFRRAFLGDFIWYDKNENGIQESGEPGLEGVKVTLIAQSTGMTNETYSDAAGYYAFSQIKPGDYTLVFDIPLTYQPTLMDQAVEAEDSDIDITGRVTDISLTSGMVNMDIDAGFISTSKAVIGDFVWEDINGNGVQDFGEPGIGGIQVEIQGVSVNGEVISKQTTTAFDGLYGFSDLPAGEYTVTFINSSEYEFTINYNATADVDSDADPLTGKTTPVSLSSNTVNKDIDAGLFKYSSIGDYVWNDLNANGLQDAGEPGITGVELRLIDMNGTVTGTATSGNFGFYFFSNIKPGKYHIEAQLPTGFILTTNVNAGNEQRDSDFLLISGNASTPELTIISNTLRLDIDLGLKAEVGSISGSTWFDQNGDGEFNMQESGLEGLLVFLINASGDTILTDTTDLIGNYRFEQLQAGTYQVKFELLKDTLFTTAGSGNNTNLDSDVVDVMQGSTDILTLVAGQNLTGVNAGYTGFSSIGDYLWVDKDGDGIQETDEVGLNGIKVRLLNENMAILDSTYSIFRMENGQSGYYTFDSLPYGNYFVQFILPANFIYSNAHQGDPLLDSDVENSLLGLTQKITLLPNQHRTDIDAGFILLAPVTGSISGVVWQDKDNSKRRSSDEILLPGIEVSLFNLAGNLIASRTTNGEGAYSFDNISFGDYYLSVPVLSNKKFVFYAGQSFDFDSDITNSFGQGTTRLINLLPGGAITDIDMGYAPVITIGDFVWDDLNNDGLQDSDEPGMPGISVSLINELGITEQNTTTDALGKYVFSGVATGRYVIEFSVRDGYLVAKNNSTGNQKNSKIITEDGKTDLLDFTIQQVYTDIDGGFVKAGTIGDRVWLDLNGNGFFQLGEPGISGIKVKLFHENGILLDSTTTGVGPDDFVGFYQFNHVRPDNYYIKFEIPATYIISQPFVGDVNNDSNVNGANGPLTTGVFSVGVNETVNNIDAAAYIPATLGDRVWNDANKNGIQDAGETGVQGVTVRLFAQSGLLLGTTITNEQGIYSFGGLRQRLYYLQFSLPDGFEFSLQNAAGDTKLDSDVDATGTTPLISLAHGTVLLDIDAGIQTTNANIIMGNVWNDINKDGLRNSGELLMKDIRVYLKNSNQEIIKQSVTNHAGMYCLSTLDPGEHFVYVEAPEDHVFTDKHAGPDQDLDSDVDDLGFSDMVMLDQNYEMEYIDAGCYYKVSSSINGVVWKDENKNGIRDNGDILMKDVVIFVFNKFNIFVKSTKTNADGAYNLKNLDAGQYYCRVPEFADLDFIMFTGLNQDKDSEITNQYGIGTTRLITIQDGIPFGNFDFGYRQANGIRNQEQALQNELLIYPNPSLYEVHVKVPGDKTDADYYIVNALGSIVLQGRVQSDASTINTSDLPPGKYSIHVINGKNKWAKTFMKIENNY